MCHFKISKSVFFMIHSPKTLKKCQKSAKKVPKKCHPDSAKISESWLCFQDLVNIFGFVSGTLWFMGCPYLDLALCTRCCQATWT
jgi:hypothetical protein